MNTTDRTRPDVLIDALAHPTSSARLQAALAAGTYPDPALVEPLVHRCGVEPDFFVRDTLTWAITRHPAVSTVPPVLEQLGSQRPQARSQALHTLSKIGDRSTWERIPMELLHDADDEVARSAWRAAVGLVPENAKAWLAKELARELGRGDRDTQRSLSRSLVGLGDPALAPLAHARSSTDGAVRAHALATDRLARDPDSDFSDALEHATRTTLLDAAPATGEP